MWCISTISFDSAVGLAPFGNEHSDTTTCARSRVMAYLCDRRNGNNRATKFHFTCRAYLWTQTSTPAPSMQTIATVRTLLALAHRQAGAGAGAGTAATQAKGGSRRAHVLLDNSRVVGAEIVVEMLMRLVL